MQGNKQGNFFANLTILGLSAKSDDFRANAGNLQEFAGNSGKALHSTVNKTLSAVSCEMHLMRREFAGNFLNTH
jgi:hypothetical protein